MSADGMPVQSWPLALVAVLTTDGPRLRWVARERLEAPSYQPDDDARPEPTSRERGGMVEGVG